MLEGGSGLKLQAGGKTPYDNASMSKKRCSSSTLMSSKEATTLWAHLVYGGRVDMEVEGCGLVAVEDHAGGVDLVLDLVGMVEGVVVDLAGLIGGLVGLVLNSVGMVMNLDGMVLNLDGMVGGPVVELIGMVVD